MSDTQELDLGQREVVENMEWTTEEIGLLVDANLTLVEVSSFAVEYGPMTINAAIGSVLDKHRIDAAGEQEALPPVGEAPTSIVGE